MTEQFVLWYVPAMICSIVESIAIIVIVLRLLFYYRPDDDDKSASLLRKKKRHNALKELLPLLAYPILFCVLLIPQLINRLFGALAVTDQLNIKAILASGISIPLQPFFAGLTLLIHVIVLKVHCRRTELQTSAYYTYSNAWVFTSASKSISSDRLICEESPHI